MPNQSSESQDFQIIKALIRGSSGALAHQQPQPCASTSSCQGQPFLYCSSNNTNSSQCQTIIPLLRTWRQKISSIQRCTCFRCASITGFNISDYIDVVSIFQWRHRSSSFRREQSRGFQRRERRDVYARQTGRARRTWSSQAWGLRGEIVQTVPDSLLLSHISKIDANAVPEDEEGEDEDEDDDDSADDDSDLNPEVNSEGHDADRYVCSPPFFSFATDTLRCHLLYADLMRTNSGPKENRTGKRQVSRRRRHRGTSSSCLHFILAPCLERKTHLTHVYIFSSTFECSLDLLCQ